jgi:hypothetical protein
MPCPWTCLGSYHLVSNLDCTRLAELAGCNPQNMSELHHGSLRYTKGCFFKVVHTDKDFECRCRSSAIYVVFDNTEGGFTVDDSPQFA